MFKQGFRSQKSVARMKREKAKQFQDLIVWQKTHQLEEIT
jgi:hypothetical protein